MPSPARGLFVVAVLGFVSLGLPDGVLGVAWPSIRRTFGLPPSQLGALLSTAMAGYLVSSVANGPVVARLGVGPLLLWSNVTVVASLVAYAVAPAWAWMVAAGFLVGLGAGGIDAGINAFAAVRFPPSLVNWLHASYGVGAMLGPLAMTAVLAGGLDWRVGYGLIGIALSGMAVTFWLTLDRWRAAAAGARVEGRPPAGPPPPLTATLRRPMVATQVALFFLYTGLEVTAGQWTYSLFTEARGVPPVTAGVWAGVYWASLAAGRLVFGALTRRFAPDTLLRAVTLAAPLCAGLIWLDAGPVAGFLGLAGLGFTFAPIFPLLISATPARVGADHAGNAIGFQVAAAYLGTAALPGLAGVLAVPLGLEVIAPFLLVATGALLLLHERALRQAARLRHG
jgi:fucose permease